ADRLRCVGRVRARAPDCLAAARERRRRRPACTRERTDRRRWPIARRYSPSARASWRSHARARRRAALPRAARLDSCGADPRAVLSRVYEGIRAMDGTEVLTTTTYTLPSFVARRPRLTGWKSG